MKITQAVPAVFAALAALTMKTIITSNWRPLRPALCTLLLGIAALWAMPRSAGAQQLYVAEINNNTVGEYNATTGAAINASFITGLLSPQGLAISGNTLFVANEYNSVDQAENLTAHHTVHARHFSNGERIPGVGTAIGSIYVLPSGGVYPGSGGGGIHFSYGAIVHLSPSFTAQNPAPIISSDVAAKLFR